MSLLILASSNGNKSAYKSCVPFHEEDGGVKGEGLVKGGKK